MGNNLRPVDRGVGWVGADSEGDAGVGGVGREVEKQALVVAGASTSHQ